jgi:hypothetical protein
MSWSLEVLTLSFEYVCEIHKSLFIVELKSVLCKFFFFKCTQLLTVRFFFNSEWANCTGLHISKNESDIVWLAISEYACREVLKFWHYLSNTFVKYINHCSLLSLKVFCASCFKVKFVPFWVICNYRVWKNW